MLLPSAIQRSEDLVGIAMPIVWPLPAATGAPEPALVAAAEPALVAAAEPALVAAAEPALVGLAPGLLLAELQAARAIAATPALTLMRILRTKTPSCRSPRSARGQAQFGRHERRQGLGTGGRCMRADEA